MFCGRNNRILPNQFMRSRLASMVIASLILFSVTQSTIILDWKHNWRRVNKTHVFDTWMYNNEAEVAYIRLWRLHDHFIIITSSVTFSGQPKTFSFYPFEKEIIQYKNKIDIVNITGNFCARSVRKMSALRKAKETTL